MTSLCFTSRLEFTSFLISRTGVQVLHTELSSSASPKMVPLLSTPFARQCKRSADTHSADTVQTQCRHSADTVQTPTVQTQFRKPKNRPTSQWQDQFVNAECSKAISLLGKRLHSCFQDIMAHVKVSHR